MTCNAAIDFVNRSYESFADEAGKNGYNKAEPEDIVVPSDVTVTTSGGVAGSDTGSPAEKQFFANTTTTDDVVQCQDPPILQKQALGGEFLLCVYAFSLYWPSQTYGGSLADQKEVKDALAKAIFILVFGSDRVATERGRKCIWDGTGTLVGNDGGSTVHSSTGEARPVEYALLPAPRVLGSTQQLQAKLRFSKATWTTTTAFTVSLQLKAFLARKG